MRLAAFNVQNLFDRAAVFNLTDQAEIKRIVDAFAALSKILTKVTYSASDKEKIIELMNLLGLGKSDSSKYVILRKNKGSLLTRDKDTKEIKSIKAEGRADWTGSIELVEAQIPEIAVQNTARVIKALEADILAVVEAEHRPSLKKFNEAIMKSIRGTPYHHVMVIDGNDERGIDVGILSGKDYPIQTMRSHVDDRDPTSPKEALFSRDCPEYVFGQGATKLWVLVNHFKSKLGGDDPRSRTKRTAQSQRVAEIYQSIRASGHKYVAVVGDLNDTPSSTPMAPLQATDLKDISEHSSFSDGGYPGTHGSSDEKSKIDYILLSPALFSKIQAAGYERRGMWPGVRPPKWEVFPELVKDKDMASDHAGLWVDLDLDLV